jgi:hypothetical protein
LLAIAQAWVPQALVAIACAMTAPLCADESRVGSVVPSFVINRQRPVSGAQPAEALLAAMKVALAQAARMNGRIRYLPASCRSRAAASCSNARAKAWRCSMSTAPLRHRRQLPAPGRLAVCGRLEGG